MITPNTRPQALTILQVSTSDLGGGAEKIAWDLHQAYRTQGYAAWLAVGRKYSQDPSVLRIPNEQYRGLWLKLSQRLGEWVGPRSATLSSYFFHLAKFHYRRAKYKGYENFYFPGSRHLLTLPPRRVDIVHGHNLHGGYFDLQVLPTLSARVPVMLTLHDTWMLSGYCSFFFECVRWKNGCGQCPYIHTFPVKRDATAYNWRRKQRIYARSKVYIATPSRWLMDAVEQSMLASSIQEGRVIYNGIDLTVFCPVDKAAIREKLGLPADVPVILASAVKIVSNTRKDYVTMREAVLLLDEMIKDRSIHFLALGGEGSTEQIGKITIQTVPFQSEAEAVACYYQAADIYIHAARADNLPNTVSEALACGTPVVATAIGGIPEQIDDGFTGFLVPPGRPDEMASAIQQLLQDQTLRRRMSRQAAETARRRFDVVRMADEYLDWYREISS